MADQQQYALKQILGDGMAKVTASRELSKKIYGNGGAVYLSVTISCDQSEQCIEYAAQVAKAIAAKHLSEQYDELLQQLQQLGLI